MKFVISCRYSAWSETIKRKLEETNPTPPSSRQTGNITLEELIAFPLFQYNKINVIEQTSNFNKNQFLRSYQFDNLKISDRLLELTKDEEKFFKENNLIIKNNILINNIDALLNFTKKIKQQKNKKPHEIHREIIRYHIQLDKNKKLSYPKADEIAYRIAFYMTKKNNSINRDNIHNLAREITEETNSQTTADDLKILFNTALFTNEGDNQLIFFSKFARDYLCAKYLQLFIKDKFNIEKIRKKLCIESLYTTIS